MSFPKQKRIVNKQLIEEIRNYSCCVGEGCLGNVSAHHLKTRGAGGGDVVGNLCPLCITHHTEVHAIGTYTFKIKYPQVEQWLEKEKEKYDV